MLTFPFVGGFSSVKSSKILLSMSLEAEPGPCSEAAPLFLGCSYLVSVFPPFPDYRLFDSALWNSGTVMEMESVPYTRNRGYEKAFMPRNPRFSFPEFCESF